MAAIDVSAIDVKQPKPGWNGRFIQSERMTFAYYDIDSDAVELHEHDHEQEEVWHILEGELAMTVGGQEQIVHAGQVVVIAPNTRHSARPIGHCRALVVDTPVRGAIGDADLSSA
jgi:mannose-6-phosphate isomerase-like protein (cupin superfamily)